MNSLGTTLGRRGLGPRQLATIGRLLDAGHALLETSAYEDLTLRLIAAEARVSAATAYTYFSSKDHLFASLFLRQIVEAPEPEPAGGPVARLQQVVRQAAELIAASPTTADAATKSLLTADPDVERIRWEIGRHWFGAFHRALGDGADPKILQTLSFTFTGALMQAGMGAIEFVDLADHLQAAVEVIVGRG
ncbi:TetR/AcrR family transcriptional regulator [Gordonia shandongensis]|uniref:TetR/AcrR family transcriptional regulator n=1 Tax=Gordonia shandongensis TaxID=376351 RepID=UPI00040129C1|nr:TetR/AcrR family transcriptional regulator [Gordonia shandongensis]